MLAVRLVPFAALVVGIATAQEPVPEPRGIAWERTEQTLTLRRGDDVLWTFRHDAKAPHAYFHPLQLPGTGPLTVDSPKDHVWHHGLWFCWKYIDGVNYWEHAQGSDRPAGRSRWSRPEIAAEPDGSARIAMRVEYAPDDAAKPVLVEAREIRVSAPAADGSYAIDWTGRFTATADKVVLDRTPLPGEPGGKVFGGYAGLSLRLAQLGDREVTTADGVAKFNDDDRLRTRTPGLEYSGTSAGHEVAVTVLAHPDNPNSPSPWYAIRSRAMTFCTPAVLCYGPMELARDAAFTLRYRVLVHPGRWTQERIAAAAGEFARPTTPPKGGKQ